MKRTIILLFTSIFLISCGTATYIPPKFDNKIENFSRIVNMSFDKTWEALINYSASTFYGIENFEKDSGLLTLSFGSSNPSEYITGGLWEFIWMNNKFSGDYVDYIDQYHRAELTGKMNIVVSEVDKSHTKIMVSARYVFAATIMSGNQRGTTTWAFDSGKCGTITLANPTKGTGNTRTICPTYKAEKEILDAIETF